MSEFVAALPMYDWPEEAGRTDAGWARLRDLLRKQGVEAPERLARRNADLPPVAAGIRDAGGAVVAPDPATLPPDGFDLHTLWRHPGLLLAQTCWGPMEMGLQDHVQVVAQPDYSAFDGGQGEFYSSAILMRREPVAPPSGRPEGGVQEPPIGGSLPTGGSLIPLHLLAGARLAFNSSDSMSGIIALGRDLEALEAGLHIFAQRIETGSHRASVLAVAEGKADVCAVDCRTWDLIRRHQPEAAAKIAVVGWTSRRRGLPLIASARIPAQVIDALRSAIRSTSVSP